LENDRLVESITEKGEKRERRVYKLSSKGSLILKHKVMYVLREFYGKKVEDFYVAFSMYPYLSKEEQIEVFINSIDKMKIHKKRLEEMLQENSKFPINVTGLFKHPIMILETDIKFLEWVLIKVQEGK
jgi:DNA-binding PadR family transcriptional regulator